MTSPKIAIIGAGPSGCMLGRILSLSNIPFTIYESDASPNYRSQGGSLDLHPGTGLAAMKEAQLWDEFLEYARLDGDYMILTDKNLKPFMQVGPNNKLNERPEIDRFELRRILTESLPEGSIKWGYRLQRVEGDNTLIFEKETVSGFDLIIGCEGGWSKVRSVCRFQMQQPPLPISTRSSIAEAYSSARMGKGWEYNRWVMEALTSVGVHVAPKTGPRLADITLTILSKSRRQSSRR